VIFKKLSYFLFNVYCSCLGMFHYGLMIEDGILIFLNGIGSLLQLLYVTLYLLVARSKVLVQNCLLFLSSLALLLCLLLYVSNSSVGYAIAMYHQNVSTQAFYRCIPLNLIKHW